MFWKRLTKLARICSDPFLFSALLKGVAAGVEHTTALQDLEVACVVDIGANRGQFALISHKLFPGAAIQSFEPLQEPARIFSRVFGETANVRLYPYAVGREQTSAMMHITKDDDSSSLLPITNTQSNMFPAAIEIETRQVPVFPLSHLLDAVSIPPASLLKIDVQGFELEVLKGCEDLLDRFSHLYIECSFIELYEGQALAHQIITWLEQREFRLSGVYNMHYARHAGAVQGDFLFTHA
ncbi:MAG TPA: FkbM family methyltransferase [Anaerolineales bacterium]|jgi:FkbM family methyltransferase